jgi:methyl-accepting chemotaxis protein
MLKNLKIDTKIKIGFTFLPILILLLISSTMLQINKSKDIAQQVFDLRVPTSMSSIEMINGINHSLAALRGWIILGNEKFKKERDIAWNDEIEISLSNMNKYSASWTNPENIKRLEKIRTYIQSFKIYQKEIEDIAHNINNQPAIKILQEDALPQVDILASTITGMIDIELKLKSTKKRKEILGIMADIRGTIGLSLSNIKAYLLSGEDKYKDKFNKLWDKNTKRFNNLKSNIEFLTSKQKKLFKNFKNARKIFDSLPPKMFEIRSGDSWNLSNTWLSTKAAPIAFKIKAELNIMIKNQKKLMNIDIRKSYDEINFIVYLLWGLLAFALISSIIFSRLIAKSISSQIRNFEEGLDNFFSFLNKKTTDAKMIEINGNDEISVMMEMVNDNIGQSLLNINIDNNLIKEAKDVMQMAEKGCYNKSIKSNGSNNLIKEFKDNINTMIRNTNDNFIKVNNILSEYSNNDYRNKLILTNIEKNGIFNIMVEDINLLRETITTILVENKQRGLILDKYSNILVEKVDILDYSSNQQAAALEQTAAASEEIASIIKQSTEKIDLMLKLGDKTKESASKGKNLASQTAKAMEDIDTSTSAIAEAITVIDQIAFQTNILSLNAAVEAATAGEAGKGFAVVAGEVRNLAGRSAEAANEIKALVIDATEKANEGKVISSQMINGYNELDSNIVKTAELILEVSASANEQFIGMSQINEALSQLDQTTQETVRVAHDTNKMAHDIDNISKDILFAVNQKKFDKKDNIDISNKIDQSLFEKKSCSLMNAPTSNKSLVDEKDEWDSF